MTIEELQHYANLYSLVPTGEWLNLLNWKKYTVRVIDDPGLGSFWTIFNTILVDPLSDYIMFNTYIHQLRHAWQKKKQGLIAYFIKNLFKLNLPDAIDQGETASFWLGDYFYNSQKRSINARSQNNLYKE